MSVCLLVIFCLFYGLSVLCFVCLFICLSVVSVGFSVSGCHGCDFGMC